MNEITPESIATPAKRGRPPNVQSVEVEATEAMPSVESVIVAEVIEIANELIDTVTVTVPRAFKLRVDNFLEHSFAAGVQEMDRTLAEHWYSVANGVSIYKSK